MENKVKKIILKKFVLCGLFLCVLSGISFAATLGPLTTTTPISLTLTDWDKPLSFAQFDPALGTLDSVEIDLSGFMSTVLTITNFSQDIASSGNGKTEVVMTVADSGPGLSGLIVLEMDMYSPEFNYSLDAGQSMSSGSLTKIGAVSETYTLAVILAEFTGLGNVELDAITATETWLNNTGGNTSIDQVTQASLDGTVTYTYTVPEPMTISLLSIGSLTLLRKRRR